MARLDLTRLLRGTHGRAVADLLPLLGAPARVENAAGKVLVGAAETGTRHEIVVGERVLGAVVGGEGAERIARLVAHLYEREEEKLALAAETLGRYKELTVLYDMSNALSRVLDVDDVSQRIVDEAHRFLKAGATTLFTLDRRHAKLEPLASAGEPAAVVSIEGSDAIEARVLRTGQAELVEADASGASVVAAPLRFGDAVFGLLRATSHSTTPWSAGDLKLVTSLAALAASAVSHALLHRDRLRQQALHNQIERFVSPTLLEVAVEGRDPAEIDGVAALVCDVGGAANAADADAQPAEVLAEVLRAASVAIDVLVQHGAVVGTTQGETIVALFGDGEGFEPAARRAVDAAAVLAGRLGTLSSVGRDPAGIGLAKVEASVEDEPDRFYDGLGVAALLQTAAQGRVLCDEAVAAALPPERRFAVEPLSGPGGDVTVHEVRA